MSKIAIFASGSGTNAENIINFFGSKADISVELVLCNKAGAGVIERAQRLGVRVEVFTSSEFKSSDKILNILKNSDIDYIVLAGFLLLVPTSIIKMYEGRVINIHPALLPSYGGKGMYGDRVHEAVIMDGVKQSGITIHHVTENYDEGANIFQATVEVLPTDTPQSLAEKIHQLEYRYFPEVIEKFILNR